MATGHRVTSKQARPAPPILPKEVTVTGPREYTDRFGTAFEVVWDGRLSDPHLRDLHVNLLK